MEVVSQQVKRTDTQLLAIMHLSQLLTHFTGFGGLIVPLIIWITQKDTVKDVDVHGKAIINFQLSLLVWIIISIPAILLFGLGILLLMFIGVIAFILPIVNAIKASNGESPSYFMTFKFLT
jgi:hypothetical protein